MASNNSSQLPSRVVNTPVEQTNSFGSLPQTSRPFPYPHPRQHSSLPLRTNSIGYRDGGNSQFNMIQAPAATRTYAPGIPDLYAQWCDDWQDPEYAVEKYGHLLGTQAGSGDALYQRANPTKQGHQEGAVVQDTPLPYSGAMQYVHPLGGLPQVPNAHHTRSSNAGGPQVSGSHRASGAFQQNIFNAANSAINTGNAGLITLTNNYHMHPYTTLGMQAKLPARSGHGAFHPAQVSPPPTLNGNAINSKYTSAPSLMATMPTTTIPATISSLQAPPPATRLSGNTNVSTRANNPHDNYGNQIVGRPPHNVTPPRNIDISMLEICTFFPSYVLIPEVAMRAQQNKWSRKELAKAQFDATNMLANMSDEDFSTASNRIQKQISHCGCAMFNVTKWDSKIPKQRGYTGNEDLTANNWRFKSSYSGSKRKETLGHVALRDIYRHVPHQNWPQGDDRMILTACLEFAYNNQNLDLDTSHYGWIMQVLGLAPDGHRRDATHDVQAVARLKRRLPRP